LTAQGQGAADAALTQIQYMQHQKHNPLKRIARQVAVIAVLLGAWVLTASQEPAPANQEYAVKAAFVCQMIKFVTWPKGKPVDANDVITITIIGPNRFGKSFEPAKARLLKEKSLVIKEAKLLTLPAPGDAVQQVVWDAYIQGLRTSHMVYIVGDLKEDVTPLMTALRPAGVLVLGESDGFADQGGMFDFLPQQEKIRFEVNLTAIHAANIQISSKVLRLASRIIGKEETETPAK
jgi:hypothetical protein